MELELVTLKLPRDLLSGAQQVATAREVTIGHMVRQLLKREVDRQQSAEQSVATDERLLAALQALLARDLAKAQSWDDLAKRLRPHGYHICRAHAGIFLMKTSCGTRVCKGSELGFPYEALVKRFGAHLPETARLQDVASDASNAVSEPVTSNLHQGVMPAGRIDPTREALLRGHLEAARGWPDLINRLAMEGMELRRAGTALGIFVVGTGRHLCNTNTIGASYEALVQKFGAPWPGQPQDISG